MLLIAVIFLVIIYICLFAFLTKFECVRDNKIERTYQVKGSGVTSPGRCLICSALERQCKGAHTHPSGTVMHWAGLTVAVAALSPRRPLFVLLGAQSGKHPDGRSRLSVGVEELPSLKQGDAGTPVASRQP